MAREYKKGIYTLNEISAEAMKKYPGRWVNTDSAYASVKTISRQLSIGDINGKKKYKQIAAVDVARIFELLEKTNRRKKKAPGQADFFALLPEDPAVMTIDHKKNTPEIKKQFTDVFTGPTEVLTIDEMPETIKSDEPKTTPPDWRKLRTLETAADILKDALRVFLDCLIDYERGRN